MKLNELVRHIAHTGASDAEISAITYDSRKAGPGALFVCLVGAWMDGHTFARSAYDQGCRAFLVEHTLDLPADAAQIVTEDTRAALAVIGADFYGNPAEQLHIIGITGTKGKTTTALLTSAILTEAGLSCAYIGSNGVNIAGTHEATANTTPESLELHRLFRKMLDAGVHHVVLEVSSQALRHHRVDGIPFEVQIRTWEMHHMAEYGVAAHWRYKETGASRPGAADNLDAQLAWLRQMVDWQDETEDSREFLKSLKMDLDDTEVFVFTPKGEVMSLRAGSTPVDFAYAIHTEVGNHCVGAKVNGAIVPLTYELQLGDRVEILTQKSASPSRDWLNLVKTPSARSKIRSYFSKVSRGDDLQNGRDKLTREMRKHGLGISSAQSMRAVKSVSEHLGYNDPDDMLVNIGAGKESAQHVANRLLKILVDKGNEEAEKPTVGTSASSTGIMAPMLTSVKRPKKHETHSSQGIVVKGVDDVLVRLSRCCNPVPGDDIVGFITKGYGVSIHRRDCRNAAGASDPKQAGRWVKVAWSTEDKPFSTTFEIDSTDRSGIWLDIATALSAAKLKVTELSGRDMPTGKARTVATFEVRNVQELETIRTKIRAIDGVIDVRRGQN